MPRCHARHTLVVVLLLLLVHLPTSFTSPSETCAASPNSRGCDAPSLPIPSPSASDRAADVWFAPGGVVRVVEDSKSADGAHRIRVFEVRSLASFPPASSASLPASSRNLPLPLRVLVVDGPSSAAWLPATPCKDFEGMRAFPGAQYNSGLCKYSAAVGEAMLEHFWALHGEQIAASFRGVRRCLHRNGSPQKAFTTVLNRDLDPDTLHVDTELGGGRYVGADKCTRADGFDDMTVLAYPRAEGWTGAHGGHTEFAAGQCGDPGAAATSEKGQAARAARAAGLAEGGESREGRDGSDGKAEGSGAVAGDRPVVHTTASSPIVLRVAPRSARTIFFQGRLLHRATHPDLLADKLAEQKALAAGASHPPGGHAFRYSTVMQLRCGPDIVSPAPPTMTAVSPSVGAPR